MEQLFGLLMGLGVALGFVRILRNRLAPPEEDHSGGWLSTIALVFLLVIVMWENLFKNVRNWAEGDHIPDVFLGLDSRWWFVLVGGLLIVIVVIAIFQHRRGALALAPPTAFGRGQLLFLLLLWIPVLAAFLQAFPGMNRKGIFFVHTSFWLTAAACSILVLMLSPKPTPVSKTHITPDDRTWRLGWKHGLLWALVPVLILVVAQLSVLSHDEPLYGSHLRFPDPAYPEP